MPVGSKKSADTNFCCSWKRKAPFRLDTESTLWTTPKIAFLASLVPFMAVMANLLVFFIVRPNLAPLEMNKQTMSMYMGICVCVHFLPVAKLMSRFMSIFIWPFCFHYFGATRASTSVLFNFLGDVSAEAYFDLQPSVASQLINSSLWP